MKTCEQCCSANIKIKNENASEHLHKILKTTTCLNCGHVQIELIDLNDLNEINDV